METTSTKNYPSWDMRKPPGIKPARLIREAIPYSVKNETNPKINLETSSKDTIKKIIMDWFNNNCKPNKNIKANPFIMSILCDNFGIEHYEEVMHLDVSAKYKFTTALDEAIESVFKTPLIFQKMPKHSNTKSLAVPPREGEDNTVNEYFNKPEHEKILERTKTYWKQENFPVDCNYEAGEKFIESINLLNESTIRWKAYEKCIKKIANQFARTFEGYSILKNNVIVAKKLDSTLNEFIQNIDLKELCQCMMRDLMIIQYYSPLLNKLQNFDSAMKNVDAVFSLNSFTHNVQTVYSRGGPIPPPGKYYSNFQHPTDKQDKSDDLIKDIIDTIIPPPKTQSLCEENKFFLSKINKEKYLNLS